MSKDFIKKLLREHLKRIIVKPEDGDAYNLDESFDKTLKNIEKLDSMTYLVHEDNVRATISYRLEFINNPDLIKILNLKTECIKKYYGVNWSFDKSTPKTSENWKLVTASGLKVMDDFIRTMQPNLISFSQNEDKTDTAKIYFHPMFEKTLINLFPDYRIYPSPSLESVFMIKKECSTIKENAVNYSFENRKFDSLHECFIYHVYPHKKKSLSKGIRKNDIRKEQVQRIINKLRYLY